MKKLITLIGASLIIFGCGRFGNKDEKQEQPQRIVCVSKQYNEIIYSIGAQKDLVAVDVSSTFPPEIKSLPTIGYHRALGVEGILSMKPTLFMHDGNVGPEVVMQQLEKLKIPMKKFPHDAKDIDSTKMLIHDIGDFFGKQHEADSVCKKLDADMAIGLEQANKFPDHPKVMIIQYGRASNTYLVVTANSTAGKMVKWAGGEIPFNAEKGMVPLSAEIIAKANPDVILLTDFGYDRLDGSAQKIKELPGVAVTKAARNNRFFRVNEHDIIYLGPHTGANLLNLEQLIHADKFIP